MKRIVSEGESSFWSFRKKYITILRLDPDKRNPSYREAVEEVHEDDHDEEEEHEEEEVAEGRGQGQVREL